MQKPHGGCKKFAFGRARRFQMRGALQQAQQNQIASTLPTADWGPGPKVARPEFSQFAKDMRVQIAVLDQSNTLMFYGVEFAEAGADTIFLDGSGNLLDDVELARHAKAHDTDPRIYVELLAGRSGLFAAVDSFFGHPSGRSEKLYTRAGRRSCAGI